MNQLLLRKLGLAPGDIKNTIVTAFGASNVSFARPQVNEILCIARGINSVFPSARTVIVVGRQPSQVIRIDEQGKVLNFATSEKCAAGSGRLSQVIAKVQIDLQEIGTISLKSKNPITFNTNCAA